MTTVLSLLVLTATAVAAAVVRDTARKASLSSGVFLQPGGTSQAAEARPGGGCFCPGCPGCPGCPACPACNCVDEAAANAMVVSSMTLAIDAAFEIRRKMPADCIFLPDRFYEANRRASGRVCGAMGPQGSYPLRNVFFPYRRDPSDTDYDDTGSAFQELRAENPAAANCTELFRVDMKFIYTVALGTLFRSFTRPLWWLFESQARIAGWRDTTDCQLVLEVAPVDFDAWALYLQNYTHSSPADGSTLRR
jgi:hypothetical protein